MMVNHNYMHAHIHVPQEVASLKQTRSVVVNDIHEGRVA